MDIKLYSYLFGLFGTDGSVIRDKTNEYIYSLCLELTDKDIIDKIYKILPNCSVSERFRDTNYKKEYHSYVLRCHNKDFINWCSQNGFPLKDKTNTFKPPVGEYSEADFWRGVIDGDGSLGFKTKDGQPFINLTTKSEELKIAYCNYVFKLTGFQSKCNRNQRDNIYNIIYHGEKAQKIAKALYENSNFYIDRKYNIYLKLLLWTKKDMKGIVRKKWTEQEVSDLLLMTDEEFHNKYPERTLVAIRGKRQRLKK